MPPGEPLCPPTVKRVMSQARFLPSKGDKSDKSALFLVRFSVVSWVFWSEFEQTPVSTG